MGRVALLNINSEEFQQSQKYQTRTQSRWGRERVERLGAKSQDAHISIEVPESLSVVADELLPYAFDNILDNVIKHNESEIPRVEIDYTTEWIHSRIALQ